MINQQQHNIGIAGCANQRTTANNFFSNWEHVHPVHDRLIKKTEVSDICKIVTRLLFLCGILYSVNGPDVF